MKPYDFLIVLSEESASRISPKDVKNEKNTGFLVWDPSTIKKFKTIKALKKVLEIPVQKIAVEKFGNIVFGNSILFGVFTFLSGIISEESAIETIKNFVPNPTLAKNLEAFELGKREAQDFIKSLEEGS